MNITAPLVLLIVACTFQCVSAISTPIFGIIADVGIVAIGIFGIVGIGLRRPYFIKIFLILSILSEMSALCGLGFVISYAVDYCNYDFYYNTCYDNGWYIAFSVISALHIPLYILMVIFLVKLRRFWLANPSSCAGLSPPVMPMTTQASPVYLVPGQTPGTYIPVYLNPTAPQSQSQIIGPVTLQQPVAGTVSAQFVPGTVTSGVQQTAPVVATGTVPAQQIIAQPVTTALCQQAPPVIAASPAQQVVLSPVRQAAVQPTTVQAPLYPVISPGAMIQQPVQMIPSPQPVQIVQQALPAPARPPALQQIVLVPAQQTQVVQPAVSVPMETQILVRGADSPEPEPVEVVQEDETEPGPSEKHAVAHLPQYATVPDEEEE